MGLSRIALYLPSLRGGGAERVMVNLARGFAGRGHTVDLVLARAEGPYLEDVPPDVRVVDLGASRVLASLPGLVRYLRREQPAALLSAMGHANIVALMARRLSGVPTRMVASVHNTLSVAQSGDRSALGWFMPRLERWFYPAAESVVAVSQGVADDFVQFTGLPTKHMTVIHNPVVTPELFEKAKESPEHPWFGSGQPPVIIGMGRLTRQKDFPTLIRAFALVRRERPARLVILGEGEERAVLAGLVRDLGLGNDAALPGFVSNPFAYMSRASVFVLSSAWEGFGNVLAEAMACGCPVVSTDCPSGPAEILENGKYGSLVPVGDVKALAKAILGALDKPPQADVLCRRASAFAMDKICDQYLDVLLGLDK